MGSGPLGTVGGGGEGVEQLGGLGCVADVDGDAGEFVEEQDDRAAGAAGEAPFVAGRADYAGRAGPCRAAAHRSGWRLGGRGELSCRGDRPASGRLGGVFVGESRSQVDQARLPGG